MKHWTPEQEQALEVLVQYMPYSQIAKVFGRSVEGVKWKAIRDMGLHKRPMYYQTWTTLMERKLLTMRHQGYLLRDIAQELGVSYASARNKWWQLQRRQRREATA